MSAETEQSEVFAFLASAAAWPEGSGPIEQHDTHGAAVFLSGDVALKVKRAVKLAYLDFSTLALREATLRRELALNQPQAPSLYRDVVAITRAIDGRLTVGGDGRVVEWALRMRRFPQEALLLSIVERGAMTEALAATLAERIAAYHAAAARPEGARERLGDAVAALMRGLRSSGDERSEARANDLEPLFAAALSRTAPLRARRRDAGFVRRCQGDLHLGHLAGPFLAADICARMFRQQKHDVLLLCYSDAYQSYLLRKARQTGQEPMQIAATNADAIEASLASVDIDLAHFLRAFGNRYFLEEVNRYFDIVDAKGAVASRKAQVPYCRGCNVFGYEGFSRGVCNYCGGSFDAGPCETCANVPDLEKMPSTRCICCSCFPA